MLLVSSQSSYSGVQKYQTGSIEQIQTSLPFFFLSLSWLQPRLLLYYSKTANQNGGFELDLQHT